MNTEAFQFWFFSMLVPVLSIVIFGAALIVWVVMSQRTKRQAIAAGMDAGQYARMGSRGLGLRIGMFCCGFGAALLCVGLLKLDDDSPYTWALLFLGCGGGLVLGHLILRQRLSQP